MADLAPPPKYGDPNPAPRTPAEWAQFFRWLISLWRTTLGALGTQESVVISPRSPRQTGEEIPAGGQVSAAGRPAPGRRTEGFGAVVAARQRIPGPVEDASGLAQMVLSRPPYPRAMAEMAVSIGGTLQVIAATNATPIAVQVDAAHGLSSGDRVRVTGGTGNTAMNGDFTVTVTADDSLTLNGSIGNGAYAGGGLVFGLVARTG